MTTTTEQQAPTLKELAEQYPEVGQLLRDNYSLSVAVLTARLDKFDRNHTTAHGKLADRIKVLETRLDAASRYSAGMSKRLKRMEAEHGAQTRQEAAEGVDTANGAAGDHVDS